MMSRFVVAVAFVVLATSAVAEPVSAHRIHVLDGDTIRLDGKKPDIRLVDFNAPETDRARCPAERQMGVRAAHRLRELVLAGGLDLQFVRCSCPAGTEGTMRCNYGRACGRLTSRGRDVGEVLISERLAVPFHCGQTRCPKTPRPWCEG
jgi:endonuclease YncB( thermonuclease family)